MGKAGETCSPAWYYYENDSNNGTILGKLYNQHAVDDEIGYGKFLNKTYC